MANKTTQPGDTTDVLVPATPNREVTVGNPSYILTQKPLSFFAKLELFSLLGGALDKAMSGENAVTISQLLDGPASVGSVLNDTNLRDADTFIKAIAKLVQFAPELLSDLYVIFLGVSRGDREKVKVDMSRPEDEGGLSDEDGLGILETFVDQNWEVMVDFFTKKAVPLFNKVSQKVQESQPSKPLKTTQPDTQNE